MNAPLSRRAGDCYQRIDRAINAATTRGLTERRAR